ncbi:Annexin domain-containing protein [Cephalotus follicularis]|uniref:Annexin domain-containing protein n=1 Tax=Cephalotus follicularis TaxID=3775 RepID=A0A1Q3CB22_CEPFO|nr:Annexin domain-containing protein [Cephalotus follicularis]
MLCSCPCNLASSKSTPSCSSSMGTQILTSPMHDFENECKEIHDSWGQLNHLVRALAVRNQLERQQIRETYKAMYGEDLINLLQRNDDAKVTDAKICTALSMWMLDPHERDSIVVREALQQGDTNFKALVEIFVGRKSSHIVLIKQAYQSRFRRQLDQDIVNIEPPHPYQKILVALATSHKSHHVDVSQHIAKCDARRLFETGEGGPGAIEEAVVLEILSKRSIPQMKLTLSSYKHIYGHDYTKSSKMKNSLEFEAALKIVVNCMCSPPNYYAKTLYASIKGTTADKGGLTRVMVRRDEVDMDEIQRVFEAKYGMELKDAICESIPSGDYRDFLVALLAKANSAISSRF